MTKSQLNIWFDAVRRPLPWRAEPSPYRVWVSEVMLQQTQVRVVIPYFIRWMQRFPNIEILAAACSEEVLKMWEGLGYYSRARSLHQGAKILVEEHGGSLPARREDLLKIPGIGPYTAAAILSFAFHKRHLALDGNVLRVLSRYFAYEGDITQVRSRGELEERGEALLDSKEPWASAEALIELGALVCTKGSPKCSSCPLQGGCRAHLEGRVEHFPVRPARLQTISLERVVLIAEAQGKTLVQRHRAGLMRDLFEFPYLEGSSEKDARNLAAALGLKVFDTEPLNRTRHGFTRYRAELFPFLIATEMVDVRGFEWRSIEELKKLPFSAGHRRILQEVTQSARLTL